MAAPQTLSSSHVADHLANERTFLAWVRTALGLISLGIALAKLAIYITQIEHSSHPSPELHFRFDGRIIGLSFILFGLIAMVTASILYMQRRHEIESGQFFLHRGAVWVWGFTIGVMVFGTLGIFWIFV